MKKKIFLLSLAIFILGASFLVPVRVVQTQEDMRLFCKDNECLLFVNQWHDGWRINPAGWVLGALKGLLYVATPPSNQSFHTIVFKISDQGVERFDFPGNFSPWGIHNDAIYGRGAQGQWKWSENHFVRLTENEVNEFNHSDPNTQLLVWGERDGWVSKSVNPIDAVAFQLNHRKVEIKRKIQGNNRRMSISLDGREMLLWEVPRKGVLFKDRDYEKLFDES